MSNIVIFGATKEQGDLADTAVQPGDLATVATTGAYSDLSGTPTISGSNTGDVTLSGTPDYITISGQVITRGQVDLAADVTGDLPLANLAQASAASKLLGRGDSGSGDYQEITLGSGLTMTGTTLAASGGGGSSVDVQDFTSNGTWTKPTNATLVLVELIAGGGGGGSGRRGAFASVKGGGGGGGSGCYTKVFMPASAYGSTVSVTVGAAGAGGAAVTANDTNGNAGTAGGLSSFGNLQARGGGGGGAGTTGGGAGGNNTFTSGGLQYFQGNTASTFGTAGGSGAAGTALTAYGTGGNIAPSAGTGGGGLGSSATTGNAGGAYNITASNVAYLVTPPANTAGGTAGGAGGAGGAGAAATWDYRSLSGYGATGGGSGQTGGGAGGAGTNYGNGGGGGGASENGANSGAGGNGGAGFVRITTWCT